MGVRPDNIRQGLRTFDTNYFQAPGRLNVYTELPFKVILDYGHNPAAIQAMTDLVSKLEVTGRRLVVLAAAGDRRDEDMEEMCRIAAKSFDYYVLREDDDRRGRAPGEVPRLMEKALLSMGVPREKIRVEANEPDAIDAALKMGNRGDLLLVFADKISRCWKQITKFKDGTRPADGSAAETGSIAPVVDLDDAGLTLGGQMLIQDERGVRLAREIEYED
jgi:cyanophycin synthetase